VSATRDMNHTNPFQRNQRFRHVPAGHAVIRDTSPEQPIAAWTAIELACLSMTSTEGVRHSRTPGKRPAEAAATVLKGGALRLPLDKPRAFRDVPRVL